VLTTDTKKHPDLLLDNNSLKSQKLAKEVAIKLIEAFGYEKEFLDLPCLKGRKSPTTHKVLEFLKQVIENKISEMT
jgi:hypothetical protein